MLLHYNAESVLTSTCPLILLYTQLPVNWTLSVFGKQQHLKTSPDKNIQLCYLHLVATVRFINLLRMFTACFTFVPYHQTVLLTEHFICGCFSIYGLCVSKK